MAFPDYLRRHIDLASPDRARSVPESLPALPELLRGIGHEDEIWIRESGFEEVAATWEGTATSLWRNLGTAGPLPLVSATMEATRRFLTNLRTQEGSVGA
jgi:hypothetical protein